MEYPTYRFFLFGKLYIACTYMYNYFTRSISILKRKLYNKHKIPQDETLVEVQQRTRFGCLIHLEAAYICITDIQQNRQGDRKPTSTVTIGA